VSVGVVPDAVYEEAKVTLEPGPMLLLYTMELLRVEGEASTRGSNGWHAWPPPRRLASSNFSTT
jgi:hypothetical protein